MSSAFRSAKATRARGAAALVLFAGTAVSANAQTNVTWAAAVNGNWNTAGNWTPAMVPNNMGPMLFNARITPTGPAYTVMLDVDVTIEELTVDSADATLDMTTRTLTANGTTLIAQGTVIGTGGTELLLLNGAATFRQAVFMNVATVRTQGTLTFDTTVGTDEICETEIDHRGPSMNWIGNGDIITGVGAVISNAATSTFSITGNGSITHNGMGAVGTLNNAGMMMKSGAGVTLVDQASFNNTGTLEVTSGTLRANNTPFVAGVLDTGTWIARAGTTIDLVGQTFTTNQARVTLDGAGSTFTAVDSLTNNDAGAEFTTLNGRTFTTAGAFTNDGTVDAGAAFTTMGGLTNSGMLTNRGVLTTNGNLSNSGMLDARANANTTGDFTNTGTLDTAAATTFDVAGNLTNVAAGTLTGGTYNLAGILEANNLTGITNIAADVRLDGVGAVIRNGVGADAIDNLTDVSGGGSLELLNGKMVDTSVDFTVGATSRLTVGAGSSFRVTDDGDLTNFTGGQLTDGIFEIAGTLQARNLAVATIDNDFTIDGPGAMFLDDIGNDALAGLDTITTNGAFTVSGGRTATTIAGNFAVQGQLNVRDALTVLTINQNLNQAGGGVSVTAGELRVLGDFNQTSGNLNLGGGAITAANFNLNGSLTGSGTLNGDVVTDGIIQPGSSPGAVTISGSLTLEGPSDVTMELGGLLPDDFDRLIITDSLTFDGMFAGTLHVRATGGYVPHLGDEFEIVTFASRVGMFRDHDVDLGGGLSVEVLYGDESIVVRVVPAPAAVSCLLVGILAWRRRRGQ